VGLMATAPPFNAVAAGGCRCCRAPGGCGGAESPQEGSSACRGAAGHRVGAAGGGSAEPRGCAGCSGVTGCGGERGAVSPPARAEGKGAFAACWEL